MIMIHKILNFVNCSQISIQNSDATRKFFFKKKKKFQLRAPDRFCFAMFSKIIPSSPNIPNKKDKQFLQKCSSNFCTSNINNNITWKKNEHGNEHKKFLPSKKYTQLLEKFSFSFWNIAKGQFVGRDNNCQPATYQMHLTLETWTI